MRSVILGGTGTLGQELVRQLPDNDVLVISRDEQKQVLMKKDFPKVKYILGDINDYHSIRDHLRPGDTVYHVAALKHVDVLEDNVDQCLRTNVIGTQNVIRACRSAGVNQLAFSSTDKAVDPINTYGYSKALAERLVSQSLISWKIFRWGNVIGSRGSAIPFFIKTIKESGIAYITHSEMTRFWLTIEDAVGFMIDSTKNPRSGEYLYPKMKAASVMRICFILARILDCELRFESTGIRPGEKLHESLVSVHKAHHINSMDCAQYSDQELSDLLYPLVKRFA